MTNTTPTRTLVIEREMPHSPEKIWRALTQSSLIEEWLMKNDFQPSVGHQFSFRATPVPNWNGVVDCKVLLVEPTSRLSYSWGSMGLESVVAWTLTPTPSGTHVRMEQSGFRSEEDASFKGANYGWQKFIGNLERVVEGFDGMKGRTVGYWICTVLVAFFIGSGGIVQFLFLRGNLHGTVPVLGYPLYFMVILGFWKTLGAIAILAPRFPRLKEWAYAGIFFDLTGAAASCAAVGGYGAYGFHVIAPLLLAVLMVASWALRPPDRVLGVLFPAKNSTPV